MLEALILKYKGEVAVHYETLKIYIENPVAIGEHPQHAEEMDTILGQIAELEDKIQVAEDFLAARTQARTLLSD